MIIKVRVKTGSCESKIDLSNPEELIVRLKKRPVDNEANRELIGLISEYYKVSRSNIRIKSGEKNKNKLIEVNLDI